MDLRENQYNFIEKVKREYNWTIDWHLNLKKLRLTSFPPGEIPRTSHHDKKTPPKRVVSFLLKISRASSRRDFAREFAPSYKASDTEATEQCCAPIAPNTHSVAYANPATSSPGEIPRTSHHDKSTTNSHKPFPYDTFWCIPLAVYCHASRREWELCIAGQIVASMSERQTSTGICYSAADTPNDARYHQRWYAHTVYGILPSEQMTVGRARTIRLAESKMRVAIPIRVSQSISNSNTGISSGMNMRSLAAYERVRRALRGVCEPSDVRRRVRFLVRVTRTKKHHPFGWCRSDSKSLGHRAVEILHGNLLRLTRLPTRKRRSNVANPATFVAGWDSSYEPPRQKNTTQKGGVSWWLVRESNPCFQRERLTS